MRSQNLLEKSPSLLVVIVNYRTAQLTIDCLRSLVNEVGTLSKVQVVVVDNNSGRFALWEKINAGDRG